LADGGAEIEMLNDLINILREAVYGGAEVFLQ